MIAEIDRNEHLWNDVTGELQHGYSYTNLENEMRFAFTIDEENEVEEIDEQAWEAFPTADQISAELVRLEDDDQLYCALSVIVYISGIDKQLLRQYR